MEAKTNLGDVMTEKGFKADSKELKALNSIRLIKEASRKSPELIEAYLKEEMSQYGRYPWETRLCRVAHTFLECKKCNLPMALIDQTLADSEGLKVSYMKKYRVRWGITAYEKTKPGGAVKSIPGIEGGTMETKQDALEPDAPKPEPMTLYALFGGISSLLKTFFESRK